MAKENIILSANSAWYLKNFRISTIELLLKAGYRVICICPFDAKNSAKLLNLGCKIHNLKMQPQGTNIFFDLITFIQIAFYLIRYKPLAILNFTIKNNIYGALAAALTRTPVINNISGLGTVFINKTLKTRIVRYLYRISKKYTFKVYCQNKDDFKFLINEKLVDESKLFILPGSGVNLDFFNPEHRLKIKKKHINILYAGRLIYDKGLKELFEACKNLNLNGKILHLTLCGSRNNENITNIPENVLDFWNSNEWCDVIDHVDDVRNLLSKSDVFILPSYREGLPRSLLEAAAFELPIITTDVPGCREVVISNYNGLLCEAKSIISLTKAINSFLSLSDIEKFKMGKNGRKHVKKYYDENIVLKYILDDISFLKQK